MGHKHEVIYHPDRNLLGKILFGRLVMNEWPCKVEKWEEILIEKLIVREK